MKHFSSFIVFSLFSINIGAQVLMGTNGEYEQNFNSLSNTGPFASWINNQSIQNWYIQLGISNISNYRISTGTNTLNGIQSFGNLNSTDRSLGSKNNNGNNNGSVSNNYAYGVLLRNTSGQIINNISISFDSPYFGEVINSPSQNLTCWYKISSSPITNTEASRTQGWIQLNALTVIRSSTTQTSAEFIDVPIPNLTLANNEFIMIRWVDKDEAGADINFAIDNVKIKWTSQYPYYRDVDQDGFGSSYEIVYASTQPTGFVANFLDCNDLDATINPNTVWYVDSDGDGFGVNSNSISSCTQPTGYVLNNLDCDDNNANINPNSIWFKDNDGDGFGSNLTSVISCFQPVGFVLNNLDCNDYNPTINPNTLWFKDADQDGFGSILTFVSACNQPLGYVSNNLDCNDSNALINPNTLWYKDIDSDGFGANNETLTSCIQPNGFVLNNLDCNDLDININPNTIWYIDVDGDGFGFPSISQISCTQPAGFVSNNTDCNDSDSNINPNNLWYLDEDGDGFGDDSETILACLPPSGYVNNSLDCDDSNPNLGNNFFLNKPASISGNNKGFCFGEATYRTFQIDMVANASHYTWIVPNGMAIVNGQGTTEIEVAISNNFSGGDIQVKAENACAESDYTSMTIFTTLGAAESISGVRVICNTNVETTYSCPPIPGASSYNWTVPVGINIVSGQGTNSITVISTNSFESGPVRVQGINGCGAGDLISYWIYTSPRQPNNIQGMSQAVCNATASTATYTLTTNPSAFSYTWSLPNGMTLISGQGSNTINVSISGSSFDGSQISVVANNDCGSSIPRTLNLASLPTRPGSISGAIIGICSAGINNPSYSISSVSNATSYTWSTPTGMTLSAGQGSNSITTTVSNLFTTGVLSVVSNNLCGSSASRTLSLNSIPAMPGAINVFDNICPTTASEFTYSISPVSGAISYTWSFPSITLRNSTITGAAIYGVSGQGTTNYTLATTTNLNTARIGVTANNACGSSPVRSITQIAYPLVPTITGTTSPCGNALYLGSGNSPATAYTYQWITPTGMNITSGQGTTSLSTTVNSNISGNLTYRVTNGCGSAQRVLAISTTGCTGAREYIETINEITELTNLSVYPNPTNESVNIEINTTEFNQAEISILNLNGSVLQATSNRIKDEMLQTSFDLSALPSGVYFVKVVFENGTSKVVKVQKI